MTLLSGQISQSAQYCYTVHRGGIVPGIRISRLAVMEIYWPEHCRPLAGTSQLRLNENGSLSILRQNVRRAWRCDDVLQMRPWLPTGWYIIIDFIEFCMASWQTEKAVSGLIVNHLITGFCKYTQKSITRFPNYWHIRGYLNSRLHSLLLS